MNLDNPIKPSYAAVELDDGTTYSGVRVTFQDRRKLEKTMKAQGWNTTDNVFTISAFLAWSAGRRVKAHDLGFEAFLNQLLDVELSQPGPQAPQEDDELTPTQTAAITG